MSNVNEIKRNPSCSYSSLGSTWAGKMAQPLSSVVNSYTVPKLCAQGEGPNYPPRYDTLSHGGANNCGGYFKLPSAYPSADCSSCKVNYTERTCLGQIPCEVNTTTAVTGKLVEETKGVVSGAVVPTPEQKAEGEKVVEKYLRTRYGGY